MSKALIFACAKNMYFLHKLEKKCVKTKCCCLTCFEGLCDAKY